MLTLSWHVSKVRRPSRDSTRVCFNRYVCVDFMNAWRKASPVSQTTNSQTVRTKWRQLFYFDWTFKNLQCTARETLAPVGMQSSLGRWMSKFQRHQDIRYDHKLKRLTNNWSLWIWGGLSKGAQPNYASLLLWYFCSRMRLLYAL